MQGEPLPPHCSDPMFLQDFAMRGEPLPPECQSATSFWDMFGNMFSQGKAPQPQGEVSPNTVAPIDCEWEWGEWQEWSEWEDTGDGESEWRERSRQKVMTQSAEYGGNPCSNMEATDIEREERPLEKTETPPPTATNGGGGEEDDSEEVVEESRWSELAEKGKTGLMYAGGVGVIGLGTWLYFKFRG